MKFISVVHQYTFVQSSHTFRFQTLFQFTYAFFNSQTMSSIPVGGRIEYSTDLYDIYPSQPLKSRLFPAARMFFPTLPLKSRLFLAARMLFPPYHWSPDFSRLPECFSPSCPWSPDFSWQPGECWSPDFSWQPGELWSLNRCWPGKCTSESPYLHYKSVFCGNPVCPYTFMLHTYL